MKEGMKVGPFSCSAISQKYWCLLSELTQRSELEFERRGRLYDCKQTSHKPSSAGSYIKFFPHNLYSKVNIWTTSRNVDPTQKMSHKSIRQTFGALILYLYAMCFTGKRNVFASWMFFRQFESGLFVYCIV